MSYRRELDRLKCYGCLTVKDSSVFGQSASGTPDRYCRICRAKMRHNVPCGWFEDTLSEQGGKCAPCRVHADDYGRNFVIDHDHACCPDTSLCGQCTRGLLCTPCNTGLGQFRDNVAALKHAVVYLTRQPSAPHR